MVVDLPEHKPTGSLASYIAQLEETRAILLRSIEDVSQEMLDFTPNHDTIESIATLLYHIAGVEWSWTIEDIGGQEMEYEKWKHAFALRDWANIPQIRDKPLSFYLDTLQEVRTEVLDFLKQFNDENLTEDVADGHTLQWILYHINEHELTHIGQIRLLKRVYKINSPN